MLVALIPALLATWVSYWSTNLFKSLRNRTGRITCLVCPGVLALMTGISLGAYMGVSGVDVHVSTGGGRAIEALLLGATMLLVITTLLVASIVVRLSEQFSPSKS